MIIVACPEVNRNIFEWYLATEWGAGLAGHITQLTYPEIFRLPTLPRGSWILTGIDRLSPAGRRALRLVADRLQTAGVPLLNQPANVLLRYELLDWLHRTGVNTFRVVRARDSWSGLRFPVFLREENQHTGNLSPLLHNQQELRQALTHVKLKGFALDELLIVEFCDTSIAGTFRKYSAYNIDGAIIPRFDQASPDWMVKSEGQGRDDQAAIDEVRYITENPHRETLPKLFAGAGITYGRIDYGVLNGAVQAWEINTAPTVAFSPAIRPDTPQRARYRALARPGRERFYGAFERALLDFEARGAEGDAINCAVPRTLLAEWERETRAHDRRLRRRQAIAGVADHPLVGGLTRWVVPAVRGAARRLGW